MTVRRILPLVAMFFLATSLLAAPAPEEVPTFQLRARVTSIGGAAPGEQKFVFRVGPNASETTGGGWSEWIVYGRAQVEETLKGYPAIYMPGFPVVTALSVDGVIDPTVIEAELKLDETGEVIRLAGELFGPSLGILLWRDEAKKPRAATMAEYNRRYWEPLKDVNIPPERRPKKFPITDRFIGGDSDRRNWREGINALTAAGMSAIMLPPSAPIRALLKEAGVEQTAWAVYSPPGYAFSDAMPSQPAPQAPDAWAAELAKQYTDAGYDLEEIAIYTMSDEPGWYYPAQFKMLENQGSLARFHEYLKAQGLQPGDVGATDWKDVKPVGRSGAKNLPSKRLFYWTMRFFPWDSTRYFAECTRAMEKAFYPGIPLATNFNFFAGRFYVPGPVANNPDKQHPDAAMGGHDWLEFGRMRGCTMLWTEDWFSDAQAYQWSFYCSKLRCAAEKGGVEFGSYVIPRTSGDREDGMLQKMLTIAGSGGRAIKFFVFGPEYTFPGNCYSERPELLKKIAEANAMIGAAEDLLLAGRRPRPQVAILSPRSAQAWDAKDQEIAQGISDATNVNLNGSTVDYMAEVFDLYLALQHANIPVDFVEEEDLSPEGLTNYKVLYVTEPNVPEEGQQGLVEWVKGGGSLVTVSGAAMRDRYDEPCTVLADAMGIKETPRERILVPNLDALEKVGSFDVADAGPFDAWGALGTMETEADGTTIQAAKKGDTNPPVHFRKLGKGTYVHFAWLPGLSYAKSSTEQRDRLPIGFSPAIRSWITWPAEAAGFTRPIESDQPLIETPVLLSEKGAAITVLNWTGEPVEDLKLTVRLPFQPGSVESVHGGKVQAEPGADGSTILTLPVGGADILLLRAIARFAHSARAGVRGQESGVGGQSPNAECI